MVDVVTGARATAALRGVTSTTRVIDMADKIFLLDPNLAPLTALMMRARKQEAINPEFAWHEDEYIPDFDTVDTTVTYATNATQVQVDNGAYFKAGSVVLNLTTAEKMLVTGVTGNVLNVTRDIGGTTAAAVNDADDLMIIGSAYAENADTPDPQSTKKVRHYNYTQIMRTAMGVSGTQDKSEIYGGNDLAWQHKKLGKEHMIDIEMAFLFGSREEVTTGNYPIRYTGGLIDRITTNATVMTTVTRYLMEEFLRDAFRYGSDTKILFASRTLTSYLSYIAGAELQTRPEDQKFGIAIKRWLSPHGQLLIVTHNLLRDAPSGSGAGYEDYGLVVDMDAIAYRYMRGRDTKLRTNVQSPGVDGKVDEYLTECGLQVIQEKCHAKITGIAGVKTNTGTLTFMP